MALPVGFGELFNFSDSTPIDEAIRKIELLNTVYDDLVAAASKNSQEYAGALKMIADAARKLEDELQQLDATEKKQQETIAEGAAEADKLLKQSETYTKSLNEERAALALLTEQQEKLNNSKKRLQDISKAEAGSIADLKKQLSEAEKAYVNMGDATDQAIKQEQLNKISALSKNIDTVSAALKNAKKSTDVAAGSYNELSARVKDAETKLRAMKGGIGSNSDEFKRLQKIVKDGNKQLEEFNEKIGKGSKTKELTKDLAGLIPGFDGITFAINTVNKAMLLLAANPVGAVIVAIGAAIGALAAYFRSGTEGQDDFNKVLKIAEAIFETLLDILEPLGKALFEALSEPKKLWEDFLNLIKPLKDQITSVFEDPIGALKRFGQAIIDNVISRLVGLGKVFEATWKIISSGFTEGYKDLANAGIQAISGIENAVDKVANAATAAWDAVSEAAAKAQIELEKRIALANKIAKLENQLRKDRIADITDDAKTELQVNKLLLESKDKLKFSDEERFSKLRKANKELEEQLKGDLQLVRDEIALQRLQIQQSGDTYEAREKLANLQAQEMKLQSDFFVARKRRQAAEIALIREIEKEEVDRIKREQEAQKQLNAAIVAGRMAANNAVLADDRSSLDERLDAIQYLAKDEQKLVDENFNKLYADAKEQAMQRIELDSDTLDKIYSNESISINERIAQERAAKEELLDQDKAFVDTREALNVQYANEVDKINQKMLQSTEDNVYKQWQRDYENLLATIDERSATESLGLNEAFQQGEISLRKFESTRKKVQEEAQIRSLKSQLDYLEQQADAFKKAGHDTTKLEAEIAKTRLAISDATNEELIEKEKYLKEQLTSLKQAAYDTALSIVQSANQKEQIEGAKKLEIIKADTERQVATIDAGLAAQLASQTLTEEQKLQIQADAMDQKQKIQNDAAAREDAIKKQQADAARRQAIFDKAVSVLEIGINTSVAISKSLALSPATGGLPFSAIAAAIGALQIAAVLARPLPAFEEGTLSAPGGESLINEKGPELIVSPSGRAKVFDTKGPIITDIEKGSRVYTAAETAGIMSGRLIPDRVISGFDDDTQKLRHVKVEVEADAIVNALGRGFGHLADVVSNKKETHYHEANVAKKIIEGMTRGEFFKSEYK